MVKKYEGCECNSCANACRCCGENACTCACISHGMVFMDDEDEIPVLELEAEKPNLVWSERERLWREEETQVIYSPSNPKPFTHTEVNKTRADDWSEYRRAVSWRGYYG